MTIDKNAPPGQTGGHQLLQWALTVALLTAACSLGVTAARAAAVGSLAQIDIVDRPDGRVLPVYSRDGVHWIEGMPGHEYAIRVRNHGPGRLLAVMRVDGVNVITGDTAAPSQSLRAGWLRQR